MQKRIRNHIRSNVVGYIALFFTLSGGIAWATHPGGANTISSGDIINEEVKNNDLDADSVGSAKIADGSIKNPDLSAGASSSNTIADGGIQGVDVKSGTLNGTHIADDSLTGADVEESSLDGVEAAEKLDFDQPFEDGLVRVVGTQNELTVQARCLLQSVQWVVTSSVDGGISWSISNDTGTPTSAVGNGGTGLTAGNQTLLVQLTAPGGGFRRGEIQAVYRNDNRVITLDLHLIANDITDRCQLTGTAVAAS
jgi:hypothetical protein